MDQEPVIQATMAWLSKFVIAHNICPFAKHEYDNKTIRYCVINSEDDMECLTSLIMECFRLDCDLEIQTTLLILPIGYQNFETYLNFLSMAENLLIEHGYEGIYQLASFHPDYYFDGAPPDDAANYTNRSPYPMLHLLRESSIEAALKSVPNPEHIPERNIDYTRQIGNEVLKTLLLSCYPTR